MLSSTIMEDTPPDLAASPGPQPERPSGAERGRAAIAISFVILLLVLATTSQGAFSVGHWAPLALFALAILTASWATRRRLAVSSAASRVALASIWGSVAWSLLSMLWASSPGNAWMASNRTILYAAIVTLPFILPMPRAALAAGGWALCAGICAVAVYTTIHLLVGGGPLFLAGRLNGPVNYRNATALLFALPVWPLIVAAAARTYRRGLRATAFAGAGLCLGLTFLTQSRGIVIGLVAGGCVALSLGPDRVRRAWMAVLAVAAVAFASPWLLRPYHAFQHSGSASPHLITVAAWALCVITVGSFGVGLLIALFDNGLRAHSPRMRHVHRAARIALAAGTVLVVIGALVATGNPVTYAQQKWDQFTSLRASTTTGSTRLLSVGGQRYDLWRVAVKEFASAPIQGVGADNYWFDYYRYRATDRNLSDPHSLLFALLSENGLVGMALFAGLVGGLLVALRRGWRTLPPNLRRHAVAPAAAGVVLLGQSTVDWIWLIPGLTAIGLLSLALAAALCDTARQEETSPSAPPPRGGWAGRLGSITRGAGLAGLLVAVASVLALFISDAYVQQARSSTANPRSELSAARTASDFDPWAVTPHYLESSALETMGDRRQAYRELLDALALEPRNSATLGVLGDFEARGGNLAAARAYYRRALALNPLDAGLQQLARIGLG